MGVRKGDRVKLRARPGFRGTVASDMVPTTGRFKVKWDDWKMLGVDFRWPEELEVVEMGVGDA